MKYLLDSDATTARRLVEVYRARRFNASPSDVLFAITTDHRIRVPLIMLAASNARQNVAPVYMYRFDYKPPVFGGKYKTPHNADLPFVFDNLEKTPGLVGQAPSERARALSRAMSRAWATFARTGNPSHSGLPDWKPYSEQERTTMLFNDSCQTVDDPDREERLAMEKIVSRAE